MSFLLLFLASLRLVAAHAAIWHPSMWGYNVTATTFSYDNRPVVPLMHRSFNDWWFHGHLAYPPHPEDVFDLPAGQNVTAQIACDKSATTYWETSSSGANIQDSNNPNDPCPGSPMSQYHTTGLDDVKGCGLAIAYKSDVSDVTPQDFTIFSVNHTCVWSRYTEFGVPERMPPCPDDKCTCAFFWIHSPDSGSEQNYMNGFQCRVTNPTSNVGLATSKVARRCGADPANGKPDAVPGNCTYGAKQPLYWFQEEDNNMYEGTYSPPFYNDLYNFVDGAQNDIFQDSYSSIPVPGPNQTALPVPATPGSTNLIDGVSSQAPTQTPTGATSTLPSTTLSGVPTSIGSISSSAPTQTSTGVTSSLPSTSPSSLPTSTGSQCSSKRDITVKRGENGSLRAHRAAGMIRRSRSHLS